MARKFNPPPGWPVYYGFEPPPGWEPDPAWPPAPPGWPLWIGKDETQAAYLAWPAAGAPAYPHHTEPFPVRDWHGAGYGAAGAGFARPGDRIRPVRPPRARRGLYVTAAVFLVLGACAIAGVALEVYGSARRSPTTGRIDRKGQLDVFSLRVGDCFNSPQENVLRQGIAHVHAVPCRIEHNAQVFGRFGAAGPAGYPGRAELLRQANRGCARRLRAVDRSKITQASRVGMVFPDQIAWFEGKRAIACFVRDRRRDLVVSVVKPGAAP